MCITRTGIPSNERFYTDLKEQLIQRDPCCVVTGVRAPEFCQAGHLIPGSKGSTYIENLTSLHVANGHPEVEVISDVDDMRNAVLIVPHLRLYLGRGLGILKKPYFPSSDGEPERWEFHILRDAFVRDLERMSSPHGKLVAVPSDRALWPPTVLFDHVYAASVFFTFGAGQETAKQALGTLCTQYFGPDGPIDAAQRRQAVIDQRHMRQREIDDAADEDHADIPQFAIWQRLLDPDTQRRVYSVLTRSAREKAAAALDDRISAWQQQV
ncbi:hypothetical protein AURDEDRAFT_150196, partial [Auricularia subglabra TFB-10046 SS5]